MKKYSKILSFLLTVALLLTAFSVIAFAENRYTEWTLSEDECVLSDGTRTFKRYDNAPPDLYVSSTEIYEYANSVNTAEGYYVPISSFSKDAGIVWIYRNGYNIFYATEDGTAELDKFLAQGASSYRMTDSDKDMMSAEIAAETIGELDGSKERIDVNVRSLMVANRYRIAAQSSDGTLSYLHGTLFEKNGEYYYAEHSELENNCFDANGDISLRGGTLSLVKPDAALSEKITAMIETLEYAPVTYTFEDNEEIPMDDGWAMIVFWIFYILLGFAAPIPLLCLGLMLPHSKKLGYPRYWYRAAVVGAVWIILAAILAIVLII